ncbi:hypothetical protein [Candidatus Uabimicrobium sp. HlEnr_7]|uniref:hypothetical protein n=1 Tax=Candidatus Uabimicrobium helgolandensis TaxID=3095367 RepID=UPI00355882E5
MKKYAKFTLYLALILMTTLSVHAEEENFSLINQLPNRSLAIAHWPNIPQTIDAFQKTSLYQLFKDPETKMFIDSIYDIAKPQVEGFLQQTQQQFGISLEDALGIFQGEVTLALVDIDLRKEAVGAVVAIEFGENGATVNKAIELLKQMTGATFLSVSHENVEVLLLQQSPPNTTVCYAIVGNSLVICSDEELMKELITGKSNKLNNSVNFKTVLSKVFPEGSVPSKMMYLNIEQLLQQFSPMIPPQAQQIGGMLGLMSIKSIAAGGTITGPRIGTTLFLQCEDKKGIMSLFDFGGVQEDNTAKIPHDSISASLMHVDYNEFFAKVESTLQELDPRGGLLEQYKQGSAQLSQMLGFSLKDDFFASLGAESYSFAYMPKEGGLVPRGISSLEIRDVDKFMSVVHSICERVQLDIKQINIDGITLQYLSTPLGELGKDPFKKLEKNPMQGFILGLGLGLSGVAFFIENNYLYMAGNVHDAKDFIANRGSWEKSLAENEDFITVKKHIPQNSSLFVYSDLRKPFCQIWNTITPILRPFDGAIRSLGIPFDSALLPRAKTISRYLTPGSLSYTCDKHGFLLASNGTIEATAPIIAVSGVALAASVAVPGFLRARMSANEASAMATLKSITTSQMLFQSSNAVDQNQNGMGEYAFLQELTGQINVRGTNAPASPGYLSSFNFEQGIAAKSGYYFYCYLPGTDTAIGEKNFSGELNESAATLQEQSFVVYAWPESHGSTGNRVFAINQNGEIISCYASTYNLWNIPSANAAYVDQKDSTNLQGNFAVNDMGQDGNYWYSE